MENKDSSYTSINLRDIIVRHEASANRFATRLNMKIGYLSYEKLNDKTLNYAHVYVPPEFRRRGIAGKITKTALDYAKEKGFTVIPSCSCVASFLHEHLEYNAVIFNSG